MVDNDWFRFDRMTFKIGTDVSIKHYFKMLEYGAVKFRRYYY
jgi:hypothetical protein